MTLFGYGKTNRAIAKRFPNTCTIYDDAFSSESIDEYGNRLLPSNPFKPADDFEIVTPGIPPHHPLIQNARSPISDYDFFYDSFPDCTIWISGTNGKTTTTQMIGYLLASHGALTGGNIGTPVADLDSSAPIWALETSSFTLHYTQKAKPNIYILLPISEDHISWHGSFEAYREAKLKPLHWMQEGEAILLPKPLAHTPTNGFSIPYESAEDLARFFGIDTNKLTFQEPFLTDALLALGVSKMLFDEIDYDLMNAFRTEAHKIEEFRDSLGRLWVDDSKATNIDATLQAVQRYRERKIYLILGGDDKGADLAPLFLSLQPLNIEVLAIGSNTDKLVSLGQQYFVLTHAMETLEKAVHFIDRKHMSATVALLSPACASLDQFSSYKERGEKFKEIINNLS